jgi:hypothetical protein
VVNLLNVLAFIDNLQGGFQQVKLIKLIEGSETSAISNQTPGKHPKENILYIKHGESLKSRSKITLMASYDIDMQQCNSDTEC